MTPILRIVVLLLAVQAVTPQREATCHVQPRTIVGRSSSGVPQVSNLALILMEARIPARPSPDLGKGQYGLKVDASVYQRASEGIRKVVASVVNGLGGGLEDGLEAAYFTIEIPVDSAERDAAIREYVTDLMRGAASSANPLLQTFASRLEDVIKNPQLFAPVFHEQRVGEYEVECRVLDEGRVLGVGRTGLNVIFKGRWFDQPGFRGQ